MRDPDRALLEKVSGTSKWVSLDAATLEEFNQAPLIAPLGDQTIQEGQTLSLNVTATDTDGPAPITMTSNNTLPGNPSIFTDNGGGNGTITYTPAVGDAGNYTLTINAADNLGRCWLTNHQHQCSCKRRSCPGADWRSEHHCSADPEPHVHGH